MGDYYDLQAPQWIDFTENYSPLQTSDFFEKVHTIHERTEDICDSISKNTEDAQSASQTNVSSCVVNTEAQADLDIIKNTPLRVISPKHRNNEKVVMKTTYDEVFNDAMRKLEFCKKPSKKDVLNKTTQEPNVFKTPNMTKSTKSSRSVGFRSVPDKRFQLSQNTVPGSEKVKKNVCMPSNDCSVNMERPSISHSLFKQNEDCAGNNTTKKPNNSIDDLKDEKDKQHEADNEEHEKEDNEESNEEKPQYEQEKPIEDDKNDKEKDNQDDVDAATERGNRTQPNRNVTILTWHNHRRNIHKRRTSVGKHFVSLAEAVSRFQNETPKRFRTRSNKDNNATTSFNVSKLMQNRMRPTIPISPALVSKNRTRPVTVLSQEERERQQMEEMKKNPIKANPIPPNVLRGPRVVTKVTGVAKKPTAVANNTTTLGEKACSTTSLHSNSSHHDKATSGSKNMVTKVVVTDPAGIIVEREEITFFGVPKDTGVVKNVTRVMPFSFEARIKDLQMKKEQRLKSLQEANKSKVEFHARPVPNFSKPPTPPAKQQQQQQQSAKKPVVPCPFSFEKRDKNLPKRKDQLVKQLFEEDKRSRVFRANPVPVFKPVMMRGKSKERLPIKSANAVESERTDKCEDQENREPNVDPSKTENGNVRRTKSAACIADKKIRPLELNTDKRAKERREFDEKMKRKEMEEEAKRQEKNKKLLELEKQKKAELRKLAEIKARPMPMYKPPIVVKATKQLTNPQSPAFASKFKSKHEQA